jgi:hypothetical protein
MLCYELLSKAWVALLMTPRACMSSAPPGPGTVPVLCQQSLPENHLPQLAPWLQRGPDHVHTAHGTWIGWGRDSRVPRTPPSGPRPL